MTAPVYALLLCPIEVVKARLQYQSAGVAALYRGPVDVIRQSWRAEGPRGLYRGYAATVLSRLVGSPFYFVSYEATKRALQPADGSPLPSSAILAAGGVGGTVFWAANFPGPPAGGLWRGGDGGAGDSHPPGAPFGAPCTRHY